MAIDIVTGMRVFSAVVESGSFAAAADKLDLSRGMATRYVAQIEAHLGVRLLNRTTRRLSLTEAGSDYYQRATQVLALIDEAESFAAQKASMPRGTLRVNAPVIFGVRHLACAIGAYLQRFPEVKVDLSLNDREVDLVSEGTDLAVRIASKIDAGLVARPLTRTRIVACAAPSYLKAHGVPKSPSDLVRHNCLTYSYDAFQFDWRFKRRGRDVTVKVSGNLHGNHGEILCNAAIDGLGIILQPTFLVHDAIRAKKLVRILPGWETDELKIYAVYPHRKFLPPKVRSFVDFLVERFGPEPYWDQDIR